jgi:pimeloyl-ACP methyl ester carboxylesterase
MYWESGRSAAAAAGQASPQISLPVASTVFPGEIFPALHSWLEKAYPNLIYFHEAAWGGHFAAWERPQLFSEDLRAGFRPLR